MPKTRLISPGSIPNHKLLKNLQLQNNYISNDGDDEGISINDDGHITFTEDGATGRKVFFDIDESILRIYEASLDYFTIDVDDNAATTISTTDFGSDVGHLSLKPDGNCIIDVGITPANYTQIDRNITSSAAATNGAALWLDYDRTGSVTSGTDINTGLDFDMNVTGAGTSGTPTVTTVGIDMDIVGDNAGSGTSTVTGLDINVSGADTNYAIITTGGNVGIGVSDPDSLLEVFGESAQLKLSWDVTYYADITVDDDGALEFATTGGSGSDIVLDAAGDIKLEAASHLEMRADGHVEFDNCAVGFDRLEATHSITAVIESGGTHDTDIDFRLSNKYRLELLDDIAQMNLIFPNTSGNFLLVCHILGSGGGDHDVTAWKVWEHDSAAGSTNAAATTDVMWAGGSVPVFTSGAATDIVTFYWDADEQQCYGVASLAFATP